MNFLYPTLLFFGILAAVPFIIHLFGERNYRPLNFSSLKFLKEIERESMRKFHLRRWLILLMRALWILFLVLVLAQPFFNKVRGSLSSAIMIHDNSFSTQIDPDYRNSSQKIISYFNSWDQIKYNENTDPDSLLRTIKDYVKKFKGSETIIWISDVQKNEQNKDILDYLRGSKQRFKILPLLKKNPNSAVAHVVEKYPTMLNQDVRYLQLLLSGHLYPDKLVSDIYINSRRVGRADANEMNIADYYISNENKGDLFCVAQCPDDDYPEDNKYYIILPDLKSIKVLIVDEKQSDSYAFRALSSMENIDLSQTTPELLTTQNLNNFDMIWMNGMFELSETMQRSLLKYAQDNLFLLSVPSSTRFTNSWEALSGKLSTSDIVEGNISFEDVRSSADQESYHVKRFFKTDLDSIDYIWKLESGDPLLFKNDKVYVLLSPLQFEWNEMGLSPYFLKIIKRFIQNGLGQTQKEYKVGDIIPLNGGFVQVTTPSGEKINARNYFYQTQEPGFYRFENDEDKWSLAINNSQEEKEQNILELKEEEKLYIENDEVSSIEDQIVGRKGQTLFIILALLCFILEMLLMRKGESTK